MQQLTMRATHVPQHSWARRYTPVKCTIRAEAIATSASIMRHLRSSASAAGLAGLVLLTSAGGAHAVAVEKVGEFAASGFVFKDNVEVVAVDDPDVPGVTVHISDFKRSIVDKLAKDFFSEPSQASISCSITGPVVLNPESLGGSDGKELFSESKGLNFFKNKTLRIRRLYDAKRNTLVYVAYSTRLTSSSDDGGVSTGRYRTSICTVAVPTPSSEVPV